MQEAFHPCRRAALPETGHDHGQDPSPGNQPCHNPGGPEPLNPVPDLLHQPPSRDDSRAGPMSPHMSTRKMSAYKSDFLNVLAERGFIHQVSEPDALDQLAKSQPITAYIGFDCTAASLHIGSLLPIMMLHWMQQTGHRPIALMGGGTTRVGDPSGKDESRRILTDEMINENLDGIRAIFAKFLKFEGAGGNAIMANNADWLNTLNYIDFLRDVGRHFSVNRMLSFDSVKMRLDRQQELSFLEFNYMILQAYDFVELQQAHRLRAADGRLRPVGQHRQRHRSRPPHVERAAVRADRAADHHELRRQDGQDRGRRGVAQRRHGEPLRLLAILAQHRGRRRRRASSSCSRCCRSTRSRGLPRLQGAEINEAKKVLATEATALVHGRAAAEEAADTARKTFEEGTLAENLPTVEIASAEMQNLGVLAAFVKAGLVSSNGEARRQIKGGGLKVNDATVTDEKMVLTPAALTPEGVIKLSLGKKRHVLIKPQ